MYLKLIVMALLGFGTIQDQELEKIKQAEIAKAKAIAAYEAKNIHQILKEKPVEWLLCDWCNPEHKGYCGKSHLEVFFPSVKGIKATLTVKGRKPRQNSEYEAKETYVDPEKHKIGQHIVFAFDLGVGAHECELTLTYKKEMRTIKHTVKTTPFPNK